MIFEKHKEVVILKNIGTYTFVKKLKSSLVSKIILIFIIFGIIPILSLNYYYTILEQNKNFEVIEESLINLVNEKSQVLLLTLEKVENEVENLGKWIEDGYKTNPVEIDHFETLYDIQYESQAMVNPDEFYSLLQTNAKTSTYISDQKTISVQDIEELSKLSHVEEYISQTHKKLSDMGWVYFITTNDTMIISPKTKLDSFGLDHVFQNDIYYQIAGPENNPSKIVLWTEPYFDWLGNGWTVSCTYPIYVDEIFEGVVSIDLPLSKISATVSDSKISESGLTFLIDQQNNVIYHPEAITFNKAKGELLSMNLLVEGRGRDYKNIIQGMLVDREGYATYTNEVTNQVHAVAYTNIEGLNWILGTEVNWDLYESFTGISNNYIVRLVLPSLLIFITIGIFLSRMISKPIINLVTQTEKVSQGDYTGWVESKSQDEIGILERSFKEMTISIGTYTQDLIYKNSEIEAVFNSFPGLLYIIDDTYRIKLLNDRGYETLGLDKDISNQNLICYESFFSRDTPCVNCPKNHEKALNEEIINEISYKNKLYRVRSFPIFNEENTISEWVLFNTEITDKYVFERMVNQAEKMAGIGQVMAGVTHELKNPITIIKGAHYLLMEQLSSEVIDKKESLELLSQINESILHSEDTIYNLLDFSRSASKEKEMIDVNKILNQVLLLVGSKLLEKQVKVIRNFSSEETLIWCNRDAFKHIFLNLIINAIQAMNAFDAELKLSVKPIDDHKVEVKVIDNGVGISDDQVDMIFEPFFSTKEEDGLGLGLWIAKKELESSGGNISVSSQPGVRTEFKLIFSGVQFIEKGE